MRRIVRLIAFTLTVIAASKTSSALADGRIIILDTSHANEFTKEFTARFRVEGIPAPIKVWCESGYNSGGYVNQHSGTLSFPCDSKRGFVWIHCRSDSGEDLNSVRISEC